MTTTRISRSLIVDNPPLYPDVSNFGKSRTGRNRRRRAIDRYHVRLRRFEGRPAKSGPPVPHSEKTGCRQFYRLEQCEYGRRKGLETRRRKAAPKHKAVDHLLNHTRHSYRIIGEMVGYSAARVCQLAKKFRAATVKALNLHIHHQPPQQPDLPQPRPSKPDTTRALVLMLIYSNRLVALLSQNPTRKARARWEGQLYGFPKGSYQARLKRYVASIHRQSPDAATDALAGAFVYADGLSDLPVDEAVRTVNRDFGWGHD